MFNKKQPKRGFQEIGQHISTLMWELGNITHQRYLAEYDADALAEKQGEINAQIQAETKEMKEARVEVKMAAVEEAIEQGSDDLN